MESGLSRVPLPQRRSSRPNATIAPKGHLQLAKCVVDDGWTAPWASHLEHGEARMTDRASRLHPSLNRVPVKHERRIIGLRVNLRWADRIGYRLGIQPATQRPGDLVHVDIKKQGRTPDCGRAQGSGQGRGKSEQGRHRGQPQARLHVPAQRRRRPPSLAHTETLPDEKKGTAAGFWERAHDYF